MKRTALPAGKGANRLPPVEPGQGFYGRNCQPAAICGMIGSMEQKKAADDPMTSMNVSLPESLRRFAEQRAAMGYGSVSEYFRELLRLDRKRAAEERLEALLLEGLDSGPSIEVDEKFWKNLREQVADRVKRARVEDPSSSS